MAVSLIALLLGRLQMTTTQAIKAYSSLAVVIATEPTEGKEERDINKRRFMDAFESILTEKGYSTDSPMHFGTGGNGPCKTAVCALSLFDPLSCQFIRSYPTRGMSTPECTILQAAYATIASPDAYEPVVVGDGDDSISYIDAMAGYSNPTNEMLKEAQKAFGKDGMVATIVSVGSGKLDVLRQRDSTSPQLTDVLKRVLLDTERVHNNIQ
ncbi:hypothetical protein CPB86DRAFT_183430, partial [Serendipita vermifera]